MRSGRAILAVGVVLFGLAPLTATAAENVLRADRAVARPCFASVLPAGAPGVDVHDITSPVDGLVQAKVTPRDGVEGDWDLAVFERSSGKIVAGSSALRSRELAESLVTKGQQLVVQGCRYSGPSRTATLSIGFLALAPQGQPTRRIEPPLAATTQRSALPSGRADYRHLYEYEFELKELARKHPSLIRAFTLPHPSIEGRDVVGVELTTDVENIGDGKPVFLMMGLHHGNEWPAGEHAIEWAYELVNGYRRDPNIRTLVSKTRNIIVPVVNPDGFSVSREAEPKGDFSRFDYENKRKNCRASAEDAPPEFRTGVCRANPAGRDRGVDLNRNYAGFWGGVGASPSWSHDHFHGWAPFSEPETRNIREIVSKRQVTNLINLHTYGNLVLRPPGAADVRPPLDEPAYRALGAQLASRNGYTSQPAWRLYEGTGSTEDWSYWATGGYGFTLEVGPSSAHPSYAVAVVAEYTGTAPAAGTGKGGNRQAFLDMLANTADPTAHSTLIGSAPRGYELRLRKSFQTPTSPVPWPDGSIGPPIQVTDTLDSTLSGTGERFTWSINPSTRPYVAGRQGRDPLAPAQQGIQMANPAGLPVENPNFPENPVTERIPFTVKGLPEVDNGKLTVSISWQSPQTDWDLYVFDSAGKLVIRSVTGENTSERAFLFDPPPGQYTAVIVNYHQADPANPDDWMGQVLFDPPRAPTYGRREAYILSCADRAGRLVGLTDIFVDRGQTIDVGAVCTNPMRAYT